MTAARASHPRLPLGPRRRALALLVVLALVVVAMTAAAAVARLRTTASLHARHAARDELAALLLAQAEPLVERWLAERSARIVLPPSADEPRARILDDAFDTPLGPARIRVDAFDRRGMLPFASVRAAHPLAFSLPSKIRTLLVRLPGPTHDEAPPHDLDALAVLPDRDGAPVYPSIDASSSAAVGAQVAMPTAPGSPNEIILNVATTPMPLLDAAMRLLGFDAHEPITAARAEGKAPPLPPAARRDASIRFVAASDTWAILVSCSVGPVRRDAWLVYERRASGWTLVRRLDAHA